MAKKIALIIVFISLITLQVSKVQVPKDVEKAPYVFTYLLIRYGGLLAEYATKLNYGIEAANMRNLIVSTQKTFRGDIPQIPNIKTTDTKINGVDVRIYKSFTSLDRKDLPILIFYHGGGYNHGFSDLYHDYLAELTKRLNQVVMTVDYRLAPEFPFPKPTDDCYAVAKYVLESGNEFGDTDRVILAGDSSGGNAVAVITQRLKAENKKMPKLQILIYPWLQMLNLRMPSYSAHATSGLFETSYVPKFMSWYLGYTVATDEMREILANNSHSLLIENKEHLERLKSYSDPSLIPSKYKQGKSYYQKYEILRKEIFPTKLPDSSVLKKDKKLANLFAKLMSPEMSPGLAEPENLKGLPKTILISCEIDPVKDEGLIYSERLRHAGVHVDVLYYENGFHGCVQMLEFFQLSHDMLDNLVKKITKSI